MEDGCRTSGLGIGDHKRRNSSWWDGRTESARIIRGKSCNSSGQDAVIGCGGGCIVGAGPGIPCLGLPVDQTVRLTEGISFFGAARLVGIAAIQPPLVFEVNGRKIGWQVRAGPGN